ncbi:sensor histidine kinase [Hymenobacter baengnokdamensis]|uniref:sensor histidine kinase n=1 Tax=Hymenobacter baengnokdamensis TaxID=2615203 RepID=UPI001247EA75|nr:HAMP domain-containing sensor histidine kinase [Hymenobacter baengnokdamensis]
MSIRLRLAAQFGAILVITLVLFALAIYFVTQRARRKEFTQSLFRRAMVVGHAYADGQAHTDSSGHAASYRLYLRQLYRTLPAEEGRVYDAAGQLVFREGQQPPTTAVPVQWLAKIRREGRAMLEPEADYHETVGLLYQGSRLGPLVVVAASVDEEGRHQLQRLRQVLALGLLAAAAVMSAGGWLLAGQALRPLRRMVGEVDGITATDLTRRLTQGNGRPDELGRLAQRFNRLLDRLESAFVGQRTFVRDASHELRTPLTALIGELEVALLPATRPAADYRRTLQSTLDAARQLSSLTNGLLQIARASGDPSQVPMRPVRLDELLLQAHEQILRRYPTRRVDIELELGDEASGQLPEVRGNEALLLAAMLNVLDNACKYSAEATAPVTATLVSGAHHLRLLVQDYGCGLQAADLSQVFVPFFRASAVRGLPGHGIGLPLTAQIMALHGGTVRVTSQPTEGTQVWLEWPTLPTR